MNMLNSYASEAAVARPFPTACEAPPGLQRHADASAWIAMALDEIDYGVVLLSEELAVVHCNHAARRELAHEHPLQLVRDRLRAGTASDEELLSSALIASRRQGLRRMLTFHAGRRRWMVAVVPIAAPDAPGATLIVLGKSTACETLSAEGFARWYGLTPAEVAVLLALSSGQRPTGIARHQGVALSTVRTHVARIREKTGVSSVMDLLDMVARLPPIVGALKF